MKKIVVVEDDLYMREELKDVFQKAGYEASCVTDFYRTIEEIVQQEADLVLLDLQLPGRNGFEICKELKQRHFVPILVLTSKDQLKDELHALELGADEYLTKPCPSSRLLARTENLLKRFAGREGMLDGDGFLFDYRTFTVYVNKTANLLSEKEGRILQQLLLKKGEIVEKEVLFEALWGTTEYIDENALQVTMTRLRKSLDKMGLRERIETVRGVGYRLTG
ncbi:MAG: response regulator transcription factor [Bacteroidales bacterium]|nr:response regulator transcription factor [Clostridium sp.]MCM1203532.1 response regulator transcription factor [Bacteroidales bacterium]